jgi:hypothetical protein
MNKVVEHGRVAVIWSPGFGAGWSTWNAAADCFDPILVEWIRGGKVGEPPLDHYGEETPYYGGLKSAEIYWVPKGTRFEITEYDGSESIRVFNPDDYMIA